MFKINVMRRSCFIAIPVLFLFGLVLTLLGLGAQQEKAGPFTRFDTRLQWHNEGELYRIEAFGPDALRFRSSKRLRILDENWTFEDLVMFGPDMLIAPVLEPGARSRRIYLPAGSVWKDAITGKSYQGGKSVDYPVTMDDIPVFTRNGLDFKL